MKPIFLRVLFFLILLNCTVLQGRAQSYKGIWQGVITGDALLNESHYTLNVKTQEGNIITGRAYLYNNFLYVFYGVFDFIGTIDKNDVRITELRLRNSQMPDSIRYLCIKYGNMLYTANDTAQYLTGLWGNSKGTCPTGEIFLKRLTEGQKSNVAVPEVVMAKIREDQSNEIPFQETTLSKPVIINVANPTLRIQINDYLREDNDTVSVYLNREPFIEKLKITKKPYLKTLRLDRLSGLNEIVVYANNLGLVPPNTCTLVIDDGVKRQSVSISSTKQLSAAIYLKYDRPEPRTSFGN